MTDEEKAKILKQAEAHLITGDVVAPDVEGEMRHFGQVEAMRFIRCPSDPKVVWCQLTIGTVTDQFTITVTRQRDLELFTMNQDLDVIIRPRK